jgi:hypothetical protein
MTLFANIYFNVTYILQMVHVVFVLFIITALGIQRHVCS